MLQSLGARINADANGRQLIKRHWPCPHSHHVHREEEFCSNYNRKARKSSVKNVDNSISSNNNSIKNCSELTIHKRKNMPNLPISRSINRNNDINYSNVNNRVIKNEDRNNKHMNKTGTQETQTTNVVHYVNSWSPEHLQEPVHDGDCVINTEERHSLRVTLRVNYNSKQACNKEFVKSTHVESSSSCCYCCEIHQGNNNNNNNNKISQENNEDKSIKEKDRGILGTMCTCANNKIRKISQESSNINSVSNNGNKKAEIVHEQSQTHKGLATPLLAALLSEYESHNRQVKLKALQELLHKQQECASPLFKHEKHNTDKSENVKLTITVNSKEANMNEIASEPYSPEEKSITNTDRQTSLFSIKCYAIPSEEEVQSMNTAGLTCTPVTVFNEAQTIYCERPNPETVHVHLQTSTQQQQQPQQQEQQQQPLQLATVVPASTINITNTNINNMIVKSSTSNYCNNNNNNNNNNSINTNEPYTLPPRPFAALPSQFLPLSPENAPPTTPPFNVTNAMTRTHTPTSTPQYSPLTTFHSTYPLSVPPTLPEQQQQQHYQFHNYSHQRHQLQSKSSSSLEWSNSLNVQHPTSTSYSHFSTNSLNTKLDENSNTFSAETQIATPFSSLLSPTMTNEVHFKSAKLKPALTATVTHQSRNLFGVDNYHVTLTTAMLNEYIKQKQKEGKEEQARVNVSENNNNNNNNFGNNYNNNNNSNIIGSRKEMMHYKRQEEEKTCKLKNMMHSQTINSNHKSSSSKTKVITNNNNLNNNNNSCNNNIKSESKENCNVIATRSNETNEANAMAEQWINSRCNSFTIPEMLEEIEFCSSTTRSSTHSNAFSMQAISSPTRSISEMTELLQKNVIYSKEQSWEPQQYEHEKVKHVYNYNNNISSNNNNKKKKHAHHCIHVPNLEIIINKNTKTSAHESNLLNTNRTNYQIHQCNEITHWSFIKDSKQTISSGNKSRLSNSSLQSELTSSSHLSTTNVLSPYMKKDADFHPFCVYEQEPNLTFQEKYNISSNNKNEKNGSNNNNNNNNNNNEYSIIVSSSNAENREYNNNFTSRSCCSCKENTREENERVKWMIDKDAEVLETLSISTCSSCAYGAGLRGLREEAVITEKYCLHSCSEREKELEEYFEKEQKPQEKSVNIKDRSNITECYWRDLNKLQRRHYEHKCARIWANQQAIRVYSHHMEYHHYYCLKKKQQEEQNNDNSNGNTNNTNNLNRENSAIAQSNDYSYEIPAEEIWNCPACTRADKAVIFFRATRRMANVSNTQQQQQQQKTQDGKKMETTVKDSEKGNTDIKKEVRCVKRMQIYK